jgi:hypothetical protein
VSNVLLLKLPEMLLLLLLLLLLLRNYRLYVKARLRGMIRRKMMTMP